MKRFVWRLQRVLDIKAKQEQAKRAELFRITERLAQTRGKLLMQQRILKDIIRGITKEKTPKSLLVAGRGQLGEQEFLLKYLAMSDERIKKLKEQVSELESQQRKKIAEVIKVRRFKEGLERLQANAKKQFIKEQERLEQKDLDEGAVVSFARKRHPICDELQNGGPCKYGIAKSGEDQ